MEIVISLFISIYLSLQKTFLYFTVVYLVWQISFFSVFFSALMRLVEQQKEYPMWEYIWFVNPEMCFHGEPGSATRNCRRQSWSNNVYGCMLCLCVVEWRKCIRTSLRTSFYLLYLFGRWTAVIGNFRRWTIFWTYVICIHVFTEIK